MKICAWFLGLTLAAHAAAEVPASLPQDFDFLVKKLETNYSGFADKVTSQNRSEYEALTQSTRAKLATAKPEEALPLLAKWAEFFKDHHLSIGREATEPKTEQPGESRSSLDEETYKKQWSKGNHHFFEGIWFLPEYRVAVVQREPDTFDGIVLQAKSSSWKPGDVKFTIKLDQGKTHYTYYRGDHSSRVGELVLAAKGAVLDFDGVVFNRGFPALPSGLDLDRLYPQDRFFIKKLSPRTMLIRLPDFDHDHEVQLNALLAEHKKDLDRTDNWVIDLRNNSGGDDSTYYPFKPYLYSRPVYTIGTEMRATPDNAQKFDDIAQNSSYHEDMRKYAKGLADRLRTAKAPFIPQGDSSFGIEVLPTIAPFPKRAGILIKGAGSSGEQFVLWARQSRKVTLFGGPTAGVLDYANVNEFKTPGGLVVSYPTSRSLRLPDEPIDNIGIPPDIKIPDTVEDQVTMVQKWLERQVD